MGFYTRNLTLEQAKAVLACAIENVFLLSTLDVFDSAATGTLRRYRCDEADQLSLFRGRRAKTPTLLRCGRVPAAPEEAPDYGWVGHTPAECGRVHGDYMAFRQAAEALRASRLAQLAACTSVDEVEAMFPNLPGLAASASGK